VATPATREIFVNSIRLLFEKWPGLFNEVIFAWEYLTEDGNNYGKHDNHATECDPGNFMEFLKLLRSTLGIGIGYTFSLTVIPFPELIKMPVERIHPLLDWILVNTVRFC